MSVIRKYVSLPVDKRSILNTYIVFLGSTSWSIIKLFLGVIQKSRFLVASAMFTFCLAVSKLLCLIGIVKHGKTYVSRTHIASSLLIVLCGVFYGIYNTRLLFGESATKYGLIPSIAIAAGSFFLFIRSIVHLIKDRNQDDYHRNLRVISFIGGSMDIVLTQFSILAFEMPGLNQRYNLFIALGLSVTTIILGFYCLIIPRVRKRKEAVIPDEVLD